MIWYVALGSAAGGALRFALGTLVQHRLGSSFPLGTLAVNVTGSLLLGFLLHYALSTQAVSPELRALLTTGFCGGYTTFSTFSWETLRMLEDGARSQALLYVLLSVVVSLIGVYLGILGARELLALRQRI